MNRTTTFLLATLCALLPSFVSHVSTAAAWVPYSWIRIDNSPNGGTINSTGTNNTITVRARFCGEWQTIGARSLPEVSGAHDFSWREDQYQASRLDMIEVRISGQDWFWIDQIELFETSWSFTYPPTGDEIWQTGADNMQGWCMSTMASDGNDTYCEPNGSEPVRRWNVPGATCP